MARYGYSDYYGGGGWAPYVPVAERRRQASKEVAALQRKGRTITPVVCEGRTIARTFWGKAWCDNLEAYSDYANRIPRGRTYVRNGSVVDLQIAPGKVTALVSGSSLYTVEIRIERVAEERWKKLIGECSGKIDSLVELLQGKLSRGVMEVITRKGGGLFPEPKQISMQCSCPDSATMCKHVAAVLYGVGTRLDHAPELLFQMRQVDHMELISMAGTGGILGQPPAAKGKVLDSAGLSGLFGIELDEEVAPAGKKKPATPVPTKAAGSKKPAAPVPAKAAGGKKKAAPAPAKAAGGKKKATPRRPATITAKDLTARGIPRPTMQYWLKTGVLAPTGERGVYFTTAATEAKIASVLVQSRKPSRR